MEREIEIDAFEWAKKNRKGIVKGILSKYNDKKYKARQIFFLSGSPGSWKTEFINWILDKWFREYFLHIDLDKLRILIPWYNWENADCFQKWAIKIMELLLDKVFQKWLNIILDWTFWSKTASYRNIKRALNKWYNIKIYYIKFDPILAWKFTLWREIEKKRKVPLLSFFKQYYNSFNNIRIVLKEFTWIKLIVLEKHLTNSWHSAKIHIINSYKEFLNKESFLKPQYNKIHLLYKLFSLKIKLWKK